MARSHARIGTSIWTEPTFRALPRDPQRAYFLATSQADLSRCGVIPFRVRRLAKFADDDSPTKLRTAFRRLEKTRHVVIDEDAEELLVRTYVRHDGLLAQPQVVAAMVGDVALIDSPKIRLAFLQELHRIWHIDDLPEAERKGLRLAMGQHETDRYVDRLGAALGPTLREAWEAGSLAPCAPGSVPPCSAPFAQALAGARPPSPTPTPTPTPAPAPSAAGPAATATPAEAGGKALAHGTTALTLLDQHGPWVPRIRAQLAHDVDELLSAGVEPAAIERALPVWRTRKAGPGLLAHLVQDQLTPAQQQDPRFAGLLEDARSSA
jgi:hypothetical protein